MTRFMSERSFRSRSFKSPTPTVFSSLQRASPKFPAEEPMPSERCSRYSTTRPVYTVRPIVPLCVCRGVAYALCGTPKTAPATTWCRTVHWNSRRCCSRCARMSMSMRLSRSGPTRSLCSTRSGFSNPVMWLHFGASISWSGISTSAR